MEDPMVHDDQMILYPNPIFDEDPLPVPPLDPSIFSDNIEDFDFTFDDFYLPSDTEDFLNSNGPAPDPEFNYIDQGVVYEPESTGSGLASDDRASDVAGFLNFPSPSPEEHGNSGSSDVSKGSDACNHPSPASQGPASSQGSGDSGSEALNYTPSSDSGNCARSAASSPDYVNHSINGVVDQKIKLEDSGKNSFLKRKKEIGGSNPCKYRRSGASGAAAASAAATATAVETGANQFSSNYAGGFNAGNENGDEKREARLMRNRESAQLSRQRKKHYIGELEDKVRVMHSTIQDLNKKISYIVAENSSLKQQLSGGAVVCPPPPGMYPPMAPMGYPWMPCPPYVVKPQGSQVPLIPIPRLKPQQSVSATTKSKKVENKKTEGKTKKVASVTFLGLLFFILLFGGLVPMVNVKYGGMRSDYTANRFYDHQNGRVLEVNGHLYGANNNIGKNFTSTSNCGRVHVGGGPSTDEFARSDNASEPLVASLYVPRNDKLVKIDGNLIIHSVMVSEKAMASREDEGKNTGEKTGLAVTRNIGSAISIPGVARNGRHPHLYRGPTEQQRALASGSAGNKNSKSAAADNSLQQWFREGLAGPLLSSGMCTEVFQFDVSPAPGAIIQAASIRNGSSERQNSTQLTKGNRRILHGHPIQLPGSVRNLTEEHVGSNSQKETPNTNNSLSSMVVSVLVDPREAGDGDVDGMMGKKSLSRIFVVVLMDSVKYVTYSCMLPLMGSGPHLVTT